MMTSRLALGCLSMLLLSGCVWARASLQITKPTASTLSNLCQMGFTVSNETDRSIQPVVELIFFDKSDNTLTSTTIMFDYVLPGKQQMKTTFVSTQCERIAKVQVVRAYDESLGSGGTRARLEGIAGMAYQFR